MPNLQKMNLNYLLNKAYYESLPYSNFRDYNEALCGREFQSGNKTVPFSDYGFCLRTVYPGLLIGIGNTHKANNIETGSGNEKTGAEIKLGFTLDYVTGLPVIPGSTVKGVLRSAFRCYPDYVAGILKEGGVINADVTELLKSVFGGADDIGKVVFFDAIPIKAGKKGCLLGLDNITPHSDPLKSPIPLKMLKVIPNVVFLFRFGFEWWDSKNEVTAERLKDAFKTILTVLGIGAKTNVGFGVMESAEIQQPYYYLEPKLLVGENKISQQTCIQKTSSERKAEGTCQWNGCFEKTKHNPKGGFHRYCRMHHIEWQKSQKK